MGLYVCNDIIVEIQKQFKLQLSLAAMYFILTFYYLFAISINIVRSIP